MDKGQALLSFGADELDREKMQGGGVLDGYCSDSAMAAGFREASQTTTVALDDIMEALTYGHDNIIGVLGPESTENADLLDEVSRRAKRDGLFDVFIMATVSHKPNNRRIQREIAKALGLKFDEEKDVAKRSIRPCIAEVCCLKFDVEKDVGEKAKRLRERMLIEQKILVILYDLRKGLDLHKIVITCGVDHTGCKLLLTSASEEVLSNQMRAQKILKV